MTYRDAFREESDDAPRQIARRARSAVVSRGWRLPRLSAGRVRQPRRCAAGTRRRRDAWRRRPRRLRTWFARVSPRASASTIPSTGAWASRRDTPADWNDSADRAAERTSHAYRLLGTARLTVCLSPSTAARRASGTESGPESTAAVLDALARPVRASNRGVRRNYKGPGGVETWDDEGEPGNRGHLLPVSRLYERVNAGELVVSEPHGPQLIASWPRRNIPSPPHGACPSRDACA